MLCEPDHCIMAQELWMFNICLLFSKWNVLKCDRIRTDKLVWLEMGQTSRVTFWKKQRWLREVESVRNWNMRQAKACLPSNNTRSNVEHSSLADNIQSGEQTFKHEQHSLLKAWLFKKRGRRSAKRKLIYLQDIRKVKVLQCAKREKRKRLSRKSFWEYFQNTNCTQKALKDAGIHIKKQSISINPKFTSFEVNWWQNLAHWKV